MIDHIESKGRKKLTSVGSVLKNPFKNLEEVLTQLGKLDENVLIKNGIKEDKQDFGLNKKVNINKNQGESSFNLGLDKVLTDIGGMFKMCRDCGNQSLKDELISGICFDCNLKREHVHAENEEFITAAKNGDLIPLVGRIGDLEAIIRSIKSEKRERKSSKTISKESMSEVIEEILKTVRKDIQIEIKTIRKDLSSIQAHSLEIKKSIPPPPPLPSSLISTENNKSPNSFIIDFADMTFTQLKSYSPEFLATLPLISRNKYNERSKELQQLDKMTPAQKKKYFERKTLEKEKATNVTALKTSLKNLSESENSLFLKMRKQAEKIVLTGTGTLGNLGPKKVFICCHVCGKTNESIEEEEITCKYCNSSLNVR